MNYTLILTTYKLDLCEQSHKYNFWSKKWGNLDLYIRSVVPNTMLDTSHNSWHYQLYIVVPSISQSKYIPIQGSLWGMILIQKGNCHSEIYTQPYLFTNILVHRKVNIVWNVSKSFGERYPRLKCAWMDGYTKHVLKWLWIWWSAYVWYWISYTILLWQDSAACGHH